MTWGQKYLFLIPLFSLINCSPSQEEVNQYYESRALISTKDKYFYVGIDNLFEVVAQQESPVSFEKISAFQLNGSKSKPIEIRPLNKSYVVKPDTLGLIQINVDLGDKIERKVIRVRTLEVEGRLGKYSAYSDKIGKRELNSPYGIIAWIACCNIDGKCKMIEYEIMRISNNNPIEKVINKGERFEEKSKKLLSKAQSADIYIFRKIKYRCPGTNHLQRLHDMVFEIR